MPRNEREIRYRDRDRDDRPSAPRRPARPRAGRRRPSGGPHEEVFHAEGDPRAARAIGVSQPIVSKYTRDDRWEFGGGPWTATEVKESGLEERQFLMARERVEAYLSAMKYKSQPRGFSAGELEALGAQRASLEKVM